MTPVGSDELRLWREFLSLTEQQSEFIRLEDAEGLTKSLESRKRVIDDIKKLSVTASDEVDIIRQKAVVINAENENKIREWLRNADGNMKKMRLSRRSVEVYSRSFEMEDFDIFNENV